MKKNVFLYLFITIFTVCFFSCKKKEKDDLKWCTDCTKADIIGNYKGFGELKTFLTDGSFRVTEADSIYFIVTESGSSISIQIGQQDLYSNDFFGYYDSRYSLNFTKNSYGGYTQMNSTIYKENNNNLQIKGAILEFEKKTQMPPKPDTILLEKSFIFEVQKTE